MTSATAPRPDMGAYDSPVILKSSPLWARLVVWAIVGVTTASVLWACLAKIEEAIPAQGKLEPRGAVQPVQTPLGGVIDTVEVEEGETVEAGQVLVTLNPSDTESQLESRKDVQTRLISENQYYRAQLSGEGGAVPVTLSAEMSRLTSNRAAFIEENALYRRMLAGGGSDGLTAQQRQRLETVQGARADQGNIDQLQVGQITQQLEQVREQLDNAERDLALQQNILAEIRPAVEAGAIARIQLQQQEQEVSNRQTQVDSFREEEDRLLLAITQAQVQGSQNVAGADEGLLDRIAANDTQIATIDSQLTRTILDNENQLDQLEAEIEQLEYALENQDLRAPVAGQVFNLQVSPGYVANASEPILEIVPDDTLVARVFITNRDIGFVKQRLDERESEPVMVDVRIDSFPFSEFGDIDGEIIRIGSDALPPDEANPFFRFPAEIEMESQMLSEVLTLQSGMAVTANIKLRKRRVITILTDLFVRKIDSLRAGG